MVWVGSKEIALHYKGLHNLCVIGFRTVLKGLHFGCLFRNMQGQYWRYVDENWGGSPTFKVTSTTVHLQHFLHLLYIVHILYVCCLFDLSVSLSLSLSLSFSLSPPPPPPSLPPTTLYSLCEGGPQEQISQFDHPVQEGGKSNTQAAR